MRTLPLALFGFWLALPVAAADPPPAPAAPAPTDYIQVWLGAQQTDDSRRASDPQTGARLLGDLGTLPFGGGAGQRLWGGGAWQIGYEGGALVTWKNERTRFFGTNNTLQIDVDNRYVSLGVFMGGVLSVRPARFLRLYVAGGPALTWAWLREDDSADVNVSGTTTIDLSGSNSDASLVAYGRAGIEFLLDSGFTFGASVRYADDTFSFGKAGQLSLDEPLWLLTLGSRL
jgi:hypothetical protein